MSYCKIYLLVYHSVTLPFGRFRHQMISDRRLRAQVKGLEGQLRVSQERPDPSCILSETGTSSAFQVIAAHEILKKPVGT